MKMALSPDIIEATRLTRQGRLTEATTLIRRMLGGGTGRGGAGRTPAADDGRPPLQAEGRALPSAGAAPAPGADDLQHGLRAGGGELGAAQAGAPHIAPWAAEGGAGVLAPGGRFLTATYSSKLGTRDYKLYVPSRYKGRPLPLVVMLHGCTQSPDDFAAGTRMNTLGEDRNFFVAYPAQPSAANGQKCWNWFNPVHQRRGHGEPALIAGLTRQIAEKYAIDPKRIFIAGLSAGGAAAAIMGSTYPDLFAAIGVHSGLACGAASDLSSALMAMRKGGSRPERHSVRSSSFHGHDRVVPTIVFHGDRDSTVHPRNSDQVIEQFGSSFAGKLRAASEPGHVKGGRTYTRTSYSDAKGQVMFENWVVHGAGHAWSGGSAAGTFTDPRGPDASHEMLRFFLEHPHPAPTPRSIQ